MICNGMALMLKHILNLIEWQCSFFPWYLILILQYQFSNFMLKKLNNFMWKNGRFKGLVRKFAGTNELSLIFGLTD